jgi:hypothetical protein
VCFVYFEIKLTCAHSRTHCTHNIITQASSVRTPYTHLMCTRRDDATRERIIDETGALSERVCEIAPVRARDLAIARSHCVVCVTGTTGGGTERAVDIGCAHKR